MEPGSVLLGIGALLWWLKRGAAQAPAGTVAQRQPDGSVVYVPALPQTGIVSTPSAGTGSQLAPLATGAGAAGAVAAGQQALKTAQQIYSYGSKAYQYGTQAIDYITAQQTAAQLAAQQAATMELADAELGAQMTANAQTIASSAPEIVASVAPETGAWLGAQTAFDVADAELGAAMTAGAATADVAATGVGTAANLADAALAASGPGIMAAAVVAVGVQMVADQR